MKKRCNSRNLTIRIQNYKECPTLTKSQYNDLPTQINEFSLDHQVSKNQYQTPNEISFEKHLDTPDFSRRLNSGPALEQTKDQQDQNEIQQPLTLLRMIKQKIQCLRINPQIEGQIRSVDTLLLKMQQKLQDPLALEMHLSQISKLGFSPIRKIDSQRSNNNSGGILYTNINLSELVDTSTEDQFRKRRNSSLLGLQDIGNIQYYKILYLLGENCDIASIRSRKSSLGCLQSSRTQQLNKQIQMLDNVLKLKTQRVSHLNSQIDQSLKSTKRLGQSRQIFQNSKRSPLQKLRNTLISRSKSKTKNCNMNLGLQSSREMGKTRGRNLWAYGHNF